jgi:hypothetical protein
MERLALALWHVEGCVSRVHVRACMRELKVRASRRERNKHSQLLLAASATSSPGQIHFQNQSCTVGLFDQIIEMGPKRGLSD